MGTITFINRHSKEVKAYFGHSYRKPRIRILKESIFRIYNRIQANTATESEKKCFKLLCEAAREMQELKLI